MEQELWIKIDGKKIEVNNILTYGDLPELETDDGDFYVAENSEQAGKLAREYWEDMARNDTSEFVAMVSEDTLISWALGKYAWPGSSQVKSLEDWLDLWLDTPEEYWAGYDSEERDVNEASPDLIEELGYSPTVAYRHN